MTSVLAHFFVGVVVVGGLLWGASRLAGSGLGATRRPGRSPEALRLVGRRQVGKGSSIVRISLEDRDLLLGSSPKGIELLCELPKSPEPVPQASPVELWFGKGEQSSFPGVLSRTLLAAKRRR
jgi:flagellar biogenesis protein FliO